MPAIYIARTTGYVDDPDAPAMRTNPQRLDAFGDPATAADIISEVVRQHIAAAADDLDPVERAASEAATLAGALDTYLLMRDLPNHEWPPFRDGITDAWAFRSEVCIWQEPTLEELGDL